MLIRQYNNVTDEELQDLSEGLSQEVSSSFASFLQSLYRSYPGKRVNILEHLKELVHDGSDTDWMRDEYF